MEYVKTNLVSHDENGLETKVTLEGYSSMPFWNHDLKFKVIKSLLNTIDYKEYDDLMDFQKEIDEVREMLDSFGF